MRGRTPMVEEGMGNDGNKEICYGLIIRPVDQRGGVLDSRLGRRRKTGAPLL